jgi:thioredoxin reductase (NADPH)
MSVRDVLIVGAGPSGLATAIAAKQHGLDYVLVEKGVLVNSIFHFPTHMVYFTTPELLEIGGLPLVTPYDKPTRLESLRYYRRVVDTFGLQISFHEQVVDIEREDDVFAVTTTPVGAGFPVSPQPHRGEGGSRPETRRVRQARAVVLAIGYYDHPNYLGVPGEDLPHVSHYYTEAHPYYRQRVVIVGGRNSAAETALELFRAGAHVTLVHRRATLGESIKYWVRPDIENRIKAGSIAARFETRVVEIRPTTVVVESVAGGLPPSREASADRQDGPQERTVQPALASRVAQRPDSGEGGQASGPVPGREEIPADAVFLLTGYRPDVDLMRRAGVRCDEQSLAPDLNPETFETNVPHLFIAGGAVAGRNTGSIFIENGRFHGERIIKVLSERLRE